MLGFDPAPQFIQNQAPTVSTGASLGLVRSVGSLTDDLFSWAVQTAEKQNAPSHRSHSPDYLMHQIFNRLFTLHDELAIERINS